jgi:ABC-2 type transport system ATP-binding protein
MGVSGPGVAPPRRLEISSVHREFGDLVALEDASLEVGAGEIVGLVGRNGAGKTTLMRSVMGIIEPDRGSITWDDRPLDQVDRLRFGYMPEERGLYAQMRLLDQVSYFAQLHGVDALAADRAARSWLDALGLGERLDEKLIALSHGNQQRVQLAVALAHDPALLILDEPFAGLDPEAVESLSETLVAQADAGKAILFSSHQLELVERVCRRIVVLDRGRVLAAGSVDELRQRLPAQLRVKVDAPPDWTRRLAGVQVVHEDERGVLVAIEPGADTQAILRAALEAGPVEHFGFESSGLIDLYRHLLSS